MARESRRRITMGQKRHTPEEIVAKLRQVDVLVAQGTPVADAIRAIGVTEVGSSSRAGGGITTACARMRPWVIGHRLRRWLCPPSPPGRLRSPDRLRRPGSR